jgi:VWFA-related protein
MRYPEPVFTVRTMTRLATLAAAFVAAAAATVAAQGGQASTQRPAARFRTGVDLIAVDVQVIDRDGHPIADLGPDKFEVKINGRRRRVVTAELIRPDTVLDPAAVMRGDAAAARRPARVIVLAIDCLSFRPAASRAVMEAARRFVAGLAPTDLVGLVAYPIGPKVDPTTNHAAVALALGSVVGQGEPDATQFHLRPSEIVDLNAALAGHAPSASSALETVAVRECGDPVDESCRARLISELAGTALYYEGQANLSIGMLRSLLKTMSSVAGRKTVVLVSGGMIASDTPGGRPDISEMGIETGKEAARANAAIYTLYLDSALLDRFSADTPGQKNFNNIERDSTVLGRWLEQFSGSAGGSLFRLQTGSGEFAFDRILREIGSYYLLGVELDEADRDGRTHEITVKANQRKATVRGRRWVMVPKRDAAINAPPASSEDAPAGGAVPAPAAPPPAARTVAPEVQALANLFDRGDDDAVQLRLRQSSDLAAILHDFRTLDTPWAGEPRRTAVFALAIAVAGLRSGDRRAIDEAGRLLSEYTTRIRTPGQPDRFECTWLETEAAAFEGVFMTDAAMAFVARAAERCPDTPQLQLAYATVSDQQWLRGSSRATGEAEVLPRYERAMRFAETEAEARMRAAWLLRRGGQLDRAIALLDGAREPSSDRQVRYLFELVRGQILRALGRTDEAVAAFRAAMTEWPGAQSARIALMTLLVQRGDRAEAAALADAVETAPDEQFDPWWMYWLGGLRRYPASLAALRELAQ